MNALTHFEPYKYSVTTSSDDPRLGRLISGIDQLGDADIVIIGIPTDEGIRRNGGRVGAAQAPNKIREYLAKLTPFVSPSHEQELSSLRIVDLGNVQGETLETMHVNAVAIVTQLVSSGKFVIALGGGHDITYPLVKGYATSRPSPALINIDAHLDVRSKKEGKHHSGSSFRLLIEEGTIDASNFTEFGIQSYSFAQQHVEWLEEQGGQIHFFEEIEDPFAEFWNTLATGPDNFYVSFDVDAIESSAAPGVSAPSPIGFTAQEAMDICYVAGNSSKVGMIDFVEVSPPHDRDDRTSRLVARMIANAMLGFANR
jgi:formiminoglutamase